MSAPRSFRFASSAPWPPGRNDRPPSGSRNGWLSRVAARVSVIGPLFRQGHVEAGVAVLITPAYRGDVPFHRLAVLGRDGEMNPRRAAAIPDMGPGHRQVLGHRRAAAVGTTMKRDQGLGKPGVAESLGVQQAVQDLANPPGIAQRSHMLAIAFEGRLQVGIEGEVFEPGHELPQRRVLRAASKVLDRGRRIRGRAPARQQRLEHPGGRPRGRHELGQPSGPRRLVAVPAQARQFAVIDDRDPVTPGAGTVQNRVGQAFRKGRQIPRGPLGGDAPIPELFQIRLAEWMGSRHRKAGDGRMATGREGGRVHALRFSAFAAFTSSSSSSFMYPRQRAVPQMHSYSSSPWSR